VKRKGSDWSTCSVR